MKRLIAALLLASAPVHAGPTTDLFREGRFAEAAQAGVKEGTPEAQVLAARSLLSVAAYRTADKARARAICVQAIAILDGVLAKAPRDLDAQLQKGIAIGYIAKLDRSPGGAKEARKFMDAVKAARPNDALAYAALGGWHGESIATLGGFIAGSVLGAKRAEFERNFERALALDPKTPVHPTFYAFTLLALDADNAPKATDLLARAVKLPANDGFEALLKSQAAQVLPLLQKRDIDGARRLAKRLQAFGTLG